MSLDEWSAANKSRSGPQCWTCHLPPDVLEQVDFHLTDKKTSRTVIADWLVSKGYPTATIGKLDNHFNGKHHLRQNVG